uniref:Uncharacterized protein n=1 Tax=Anopheles coluzzii TaxID=1518534 RepID=A0A8W7NZX3_ANOCL
MHLREGRQTVSAKVLLRQSERPVRFHQHTGTQHGRGRQQQQQQQVETAAPVGVLSQARASAPKFETRAARLGSVPIPATANSKAVLLRCRLFRRSRVSLAFLRAKMLQDET